MVTLMVLIVHCQMSTEPGQEITVANAAAAETMYKMKSELDDEEAFELTWVQRVATRWCTLEPDAIPERCWQCLMMTLLSHDLHWIQLADCAGDVSLEAGRSPSVQDMTVGTRHSRMVGSDRVHRHLVCLH